MKKMIIQSQHPLSEPQKKLRIEILKKLLGGGLVGQKEKEQRETKRMVLKNALCAIVLEN